jgi:hypothetical protein
MTGPELTAGLAALRAALDAAYEAVTAGTPIDLTGLEVEIGRLCAAAPELPREARADAAAGLAAVVAGLDALSAALTRGHEAEARRRAASVYGKTL